MNKMLKFALSAVLGAALVAPALAQDAFPDTPDNHWAYEALKNLKDKVLFGYPDGLYRGNRPMSRYEFAVAINQLYQMMMGKMSGLEDQIAALQKMIEDNKGGVDNSAAIAELRDGLGALKSRVGALETGHADLKKLASTFEKELASLGVDVDAMKKDIADLDARVKKLEGMKPNVAISGDVNLLVLAGHSRSNQFGFDMDGRTNGNVGGNPVGMTKDLNVLHEMALTLKGTNETGPKWTATLVSGNVFSTMGTYSGNFTNSGANYAAGNNDMFFHELNVTFDGNLLGKGLGVKLGRFGHQVSDYIYKRPDFTTYYDNARYDDGNITMDGAALMFNVGAGKLNVWGGRNSSVQTFDNQVLTPLFTGGGSPVDQTLGIDLTLPLGSQGTLKAGYVFLDSNVTAGGINRHTVYGAAVDFNLTGNLTLDGDYAHSQTQYNTTNIGPTNRNNAYNVGLGYKADKWGGRVGYRDVQQNFFAPGDYSKVGAVLRNVGNVKGFQANAWFNLSDKITLKGEYQTLDVSNGGADYGDFFNVQLHYAANDSFSWMLGYENDNFKIFNQKTRWYSVGTKWNMSSNAFLNFTYQISDHQNLGTANKGGLLATQFGIKF